MPTYADTLLDQTCRAAVRAPDRIRPRSAACPGAFPNRATTRVDAAAELPVPRVRRARPGAEARAGRRPGGRAVRHRAGADGGARRRRARICSAWPTTAPRAATACTRRSTTRRRACRAGRVERRGALVHGAPPGHEPAGAGATLLLDQPMQRRFESDPQLPGDPAAAAGARARRTARRISHAAELAAVRGAVDAAETPLRVFTDPGRADARSAAAVQRPLPRRWSPTPAAATAAGRTWRSRAGARTPRAIAGAASATCATWPAATFWSTAHQPTLQARPSATRRSSPRRAPSSAAATHGIDTHTEIVVSPEDDIELRRTAHHQPQPHARARSRSPATPRWCWRRPIADALHPAFSKLFVQTEIVPSAGAILCTRRPRSPSEAAPWMFHLMAVHGADGRPSVSYETDRARFIGRGRTPAAPARAGDAGAAVRQRRLGARSDRRDPLRASRSSREQTATIDMVSGVAETREAVLGADRQVPGPAPGRPRVRPGLDAQPGRAAPAQRQRGRRAAVRAPGRLR